MSTREAIQRIKAATVAIAKWKGEPSQTVRHPFSIIGSGFCIDPCGIVVTCRHVVDEFMGKPVLEQVKDATGQKHPDGFGEALPHVEQEDVYAVFYRQKSDVEVGVTLGHAASILARTDYDVALLKVHNSDNREFPTVEIAEPEEVNEGDEAGTCGFPLGERLHDELGTFTSSFTKGIVSSIIPGAGVPRRLIRGFQLDLGAMGGNSGGPVFLWDSGRVFGTLESSLAHLTKAGAIHHALKPETLEALRRAPIGTYPTLRNI